MTWILLRGESNDTDPICPQVTIDPFALKYDLKTACSGEIPQENRCSFSATAVRR